MGRDHVYEPVAAEGDDAQTELAILEGSSQAMLSWQHRGMMEFYCGLHLTRHATDQCLRDAKPFANASD